MYLSQDVLTADIEVIKTGSVLLNIALGVGGFPRGRVVEIFGPEASVKPPLLCMPLLKLRSKVVLLPLWIQNML